MPTPAYQVHTTDWDSGFQAPPNTPSSDYSLSPRATRRRTRSSGSIEKPPGFNLRYTVDLRAVTYVGTIDQNLICAICRCALVDPVTTVCGHTFCRSCLRDSFTHNLACPIDRQDLNPDDFNTSPRIIINQLDDLKAKCPCCETPYARSMLENHLERYCKEALMRCPGKDTEPNCTELIKRKIFDNGCLHYFAECPDCKQSLLQIDMEDHRENLCEKRDSKCELCGSSILRCKESEHMKECPDGIAPCEWLGYGCEHVAKRKNLHLHKDECSYKLVGPMAEMLKKEINALRSDVRSLTEINHQQERRIKFLENCPKPPDRPLDYSDLPSQSLSTIPESSNPEPLSASSEYLLSLFEAQESKMNQFSAALTELEAKQTTMLFNETIPIKTELAEIRSMQQTTSMHVRWLMRFRIQENNRRVGPGPGAHHESASGGSNSDSLLSPRRLSDTLSRDLVTKL